MISTREKLYEFIQEYLKSHEYVTSRDIYKHIYEYGLAGRGRYQPTIMEINRVLRKFGKKVGTTRETSVPWGREYKVYTVKK